MVCLHNLAKSLSTSDLAVNLHPKLVISGLKKLKHLPLSLFLDITSENSFDLTAFIGGEFDINKNFQFRIGSSNRKFNQNIKKIFSVQLLGQVVLALGIRKRYTNQL